MIAVGEIVAAHGVHGHVRVLPHTDAPDRFTTLDAVWVSRPGAEPVQYRVKSAKRHEGKSQVILALGGVDDREQAVKLVGALLEIEDHLAVELPPDTWFIHDIVGLEVITIEGESLGRITEVLKTGANDVYVTPRCLIPAIPDVVQKVDLEAGVMTIVAIPGLLDE